jgi:hypothetical protein
MDSYAPRETSQCPASRNSCSVLLAKCLGVRNYPFLPGGVSMSNPKFALFAYCIAVGFILAVAFHSPSKQIVATGEAVPTPVVDLK